MSGRRDEPRRDEPRRDEAGRRGQRTPKGGAHANKAFARRRRRAASIVAAITSVGVVVLFVLPLRTWLDQRSAIATTTRQLQVLDAENAKLSAEARSLDSDAEIEHIARERYGLVKPGETEYVVLPPAPGVPAGAGSTVTLPTTTTTTVASTGGKATNGSATSGSTSTSGHHATSTTSTTTAGTNSTRG